MKKIRQLYSFLTGDGLEFGVILILMGIAVIAFIIGRFIFN